MKTAIEELIEFLTTHCNPTFCDVEYSDFILAIEKAKQKEREQIESAVYATLYQNMANMTGIVLDQEKDFFRDTAKEYYLTTFKK